MFGKFIGNVIGSLGGKITSIIISPLNSIKFNILGSSNLSTSLSLNLSKQPLISKLLKLDSFTTSSLALLYHKFAGNSAASAPDADGSDASDGITDLYSYYGDDGVNDVDFRDTFASTTEYDFERFRQHSENDTTIKYEFSMNAGDDRVYGSFYIDEIEGGDGNDHLTGGLGSDTIRGDDGNDHIFGDDFDYGYNDILYGGDGDDVIVGGGGNDGQYGGDGNDTIHGGDGNDSLKGDNDSDVIVGGEGNDTLAGGSQTDTLYGEAGADKLNGGTGQDTVTGGSGDDIFIFNYLGSANVDTISDFTVEDDTIQLVGSVFTAITGIGTLTASQFYKSTSGIAHDANDRIIYESDTGKLFYDADGSGSEAAVQFAVVGKNLALTNADFYMI